MESLNLKCIICNEAFQCCCSCDLDRLFCSNHYREHEREFRGNSHYLLMANEVQKLREYKSTLKNLNEVEIKIKNLEEEIIKAVKKQVKDNLVEINQKKKITEAALMNLNLNVEIERICVPMKEIEDEDIDKNIVLEGLKLCFDMQEDSMNEKKSCDYLSNLLKEKLKLRKNKQESLKLSFFKA